MTRMRTSGAAVEELRKIDPMTPIKRHTIDIWAREGLVHSVMVGNRRFVSMDSLEAFISGGVAALNTAQEESSEPPRMADQPTIRRLPERM